MGKMVLINPVQAGKNAAKIALVSAVLVVSSCGYKSDLYLSDEPQKLHQYDRENLQQLGEQTLQQLEGRTLEPDVTGDIESAPVESDGVSEGVVVELPDTAEPELIDTQDSDNRKKPQ